MISISEHDWIDAISLTNCSRQVHQTQTQSWSQNIRRFVVQGSDSDHHNPFSVVVTLVLLAHQMAKRRHLFTDEASEYTGASTESTKQTRSRAVRHCKSSTLVPAQDRDAVKCQRPGESRSAIGRPIAFPRSTRNSEVTEPEASDSEGDCWMQKKSGKCFIVIWTQRVPESQCPGIGRPIAVKEDDDLIPILVTRIEEHLKKTCGKIEFDKFSSQPCNVVYFRT